jgi:hypothetical protein
MDSLLLHRSNPVHARFRLSRMLCCSLRRHGLGEPKSAGRLSVSSCTGPYPRRFKASLEANTVESCRTGDRLKLCSFSIGGIGWPLADAKAASDRCERHRPRLCLDKPEACQQDHFALLRDLRVRGLSSAGTRAQIAKRDGTCPPARPAVFDAETARRFHALGPLWRTRKSSRAIEPFAPKRDPLLALDYKP